MTRLPLSRPSPPLPPAKRRPELFFRFAGDRPKAEPCPRAQGPARRTPRCGVRTAGRAWAVDTGYPPAPHGPEGRSFRRHHRAPRRPARVPRRAMVSWVFPKAGPDARRHGPAAPRPPFLWTSAPRRHREATCRDMLAIPKARGREFSPVESPAPLPSPGRTADVLLDLLPLPCIA